MKLTRSGRWGKAQEAAMRVLSRTVDPARGELASVRIELGGFIVVLTSAELEWLVAEASPARERALTERAAEVGAELLRRRARVDEIDRRLAAKRRLGHDDDAEEDALVQERERLTG